MRCLKNKIVEFKEELNRLQSQINKKIIIFVDELDRCRPDYAISTLEVIKHFFEIDSKNIKFVIAIDKEQINNSIKTLYGQEAKTAGYLRKFIDLEFNLPVPKLEDFIKFQFEYFGINKKIDEFNNFNRYFSSLPVNEIRFYQEINFLIRDLELGLRDIEKIFLRVSLVINNLNINNDFLLLDFIIFAICIKSYDSDMYKSLFNGGIRNQHHEGRSNIGLGNSLFGYWNEVMSVNTLNILNWEANNGTKRKKYFKLIEVLSGKNTVILKNKVTDKVLKEAYWSIASFHEKIEFSEYFTTPEN